MTRMFLINRQHKIPTATPTDSLTDHGRILQHPKQHRHGANEHDKAEPRMVRAEVADLEEDVFKGADRGFGCEAWWVRDYSGKGLEDGCSAGHDVVSGFGFVPIAAVLEVLVSVR